MLSTHPRFPVKVLPIKEPIGNYTHAVICCPRCQGNIGINTGMLHALESIICKGQFPNGAVCNGHYYLRGSELEFVGTV
jgi:hypothetical protein